MATPTPIPALAPVESPDDELVPDDGDVDVEVSGADDDLFAADSTVHLLLQVEAKLAIGSEPIIASVGSMFWTLLAPAPGPEARVNDLSEGMIHKLLLTWCLT